MPDKTLFVVLGAGATKGCAANSSIYGEWNPPLTRELFDTRFDVILQQYPVLHGAVPEIREAMGDDTQSLEDFLRESYRDDGDKLNQRVRHTIPLYLQDLLHRVSIDWTRRPDHYDLLIRQSLRRFERVIFVTLNYDILLDRALHGISPLLGMGDFISISDDKPWALIKLHGSITWVRKVQTDGYRSEEVPADLVVGDEIHHRWTESLGEMRVWDEPHYRGPGYPALSTPFGSEDDLNCPAEHVEFLCERFNEEDALEMLIIGYSGIDKALLRLLVDAEARIRNVTIVDSNREYAEVALGRVSEEIEIESAEPATENFQAFARTTGLSGFLQRRSEAS
jgi:hypothetical protein